MLRLLLFLLVLLVADFTHYRFIRINTPETNIPPEITHLAVLTGGRNRIEAGLTAAQADSVKNVFITGIHATTTKAEILARLPQLSPTVSQKITLDYTAQTTRDNVKQIERWAQENNITTLGLITANYHMPRAQKLFQRDAPNLNIKPYAVYRANIPFKFYAHEYLKYRAVSLNIPFK